MLAKGCPQAWACASLRAPLRHTSAPGPLQASAPSWARCPCTGSSTLTWRRRPRSPWWPPCLRARSAAPWGPTCGAGCGLGNREVARSGLQEARHACCPPPPKHLYAPPPPPLSSAMMLNVNEPEARGLALALQTMLDDLGKGAPGLCGSPVQAGVGWQRDLLALQCLQFAPLPCPRLDNPSSSLLHVHSTPAPPHPTPTPARPGPRVCVLLHRAPGPGGRLQPLHLWLGALRRAAAGHG